MDKRRSRFVPGPLADLGLERRLALSGAGSAGVLAHQTVHVAVMGARREATQTALAVTAGTLGQPITITASVRAAAGSGSPTGTVNILDRGAVLGTLTLSPTTSTDPRYAASQATATLVQPPGGNSYSIGKHRLIAEFVPGASFSKSLAAQTFTVAKPNYTPLANGVEVATIARGSGPKIQSGQTASMLYTGYLARNGKVFDDSITHGGAPFSFTLGAGQVVPGFDQGTAGMQAGESRIISIPASQAYGSTRNGSIPANSALIFVVTLESIS